MKVRFVKTRHHYDSYSDFWKLVELSGFETCWVDEIDFRQPDVYIVTPINGEFRPHILAQRNLYEKRCQIVWWNLERPDSDPGQSIQSIFDGMLDWVDWIWVSCRHYLDIAPCNNRYRWVLLGSHHGLASGDRTKTAKVYDFTMLSYMTYRRSQVYGQLVGSLRFGPNAWEPLRAGVLNSSKVLLNVHQTPAAVGEPLRIALAAAYKVPLASEAIGDPYPLQDYYHFRQERWEGLPDLVRDMVADWPQSEVYGRALHNLLTAENDFASGVFQGLEELG